MITSSRITLISLRESDISEEYLETLNDSEYLKYSRNSTFTHTIDSQIQYIEEFELSHNLLFGIKDSERGNLLGSVNIYVDFSMMTLELGFLIFKNQQGKGYASETLALLVPYLEAQFPGMTAVIGSNRNNFAMHQVAEKHNFQIDRSASLDSDPNLWFIRRLPVKDLLSQPAIPDFILGAKKIGVAIHDAGGAEQISWLLRNIPQKVLAYIAGPAQRIFRNAQLSFTQVDQLSEIMESDLIITGSGWMSKLEVDAIKEAKLRSIPCVTVLDHWVHYLERFGEDEDGKPHLVAVTNSVALQIAQENFPNSVIWRLPDFQIENYREALKQVKKNPTCVLILLEPASTSDSIFAINNEVFENLVKSAILLKRVRGLRSVRIRPHPSQLEDPFLLDGLKDLVGEFEISEGGSLLMDLEDSEVVLGLSSYALYISAMCGIDTYSPFAGSQDHWTNYFPEILKLNF